MKWVTILLLGLVVSGCAGMQCKPSPILSQDKELSLISGMDGVYLQCTIRY